MKTWKHFTFAAVLAIFGIAFFACDNGNGNNDNPPEEIRREFTITGFAKDIKVIDTRVGSNDTDLETLGVIDKITTALTPIKNNVRFIEVANRNITIVVEDTEYEYSAPGNKYSGNKLGINFAYISGDAEYLADALEHYINTEMYNDNTLG
jgi:hypothetical protein